MQPEYFGWLAPRIRWAATVMLFAAVISGCVAAVNQQDLAHPRQQPEPRISQQRWRVIEAQTEVDATPEEVWNDWTTATGQEEIFSARVILKLQTLGLQEVWFLPDAPAGQRGHENGRLVGLQRDKMLAFTWTMPPYMPPYMPMFRPYQTFDQLFFEPLDDARTQIFLYHTGFGTGREWDEGYEYFAKAWPMVLSGYAQKKT